MTIEQVYEYGKSLGSSFYSPYISDVDYLDENHYLIHSGGISSFKGNANNEPAGLSKFDKLTSTTVEIKNGEEIFKMNLPTNTYRAEKINIYNDNEYTPKKGIHLGTLGVTPEDKACSIFINTKFVYDANQIVKYAIIKMVIKLSKIII